MLASMILALGVVRNVGNVRVEILLEVFVIKSGLVALRAIK